MGHETPGQIAHDIVCRCDARKWADMSDRQQADWENGAAAVIAHHESKRDPAMPKDREELQRLLNDACRRGKQAAHDAYAMAARVGEVAVPKEELEILRKDSKIVHDFAEWCKRYPEGDGTIYPEKCGTEITAIEKRAIDSLRSKKGGA